MEVETFKSIRHCGAKHISKSKCQRHHMFAPLFDVEASFCVAGVRDSAPCQKRAKHGGFVTVSTTLAGVGHLKRICKDACRVAGAVLETHESDMSGDPGADFLRGVAFWSIRSSGFGKMLLCDRCSTSCDLASLFRGRRSTADRWNEKSQNALARGPELCTQLCIFEGSLAELLRF